MGQVRKPTYTTTDPATGERVKRESKVWWIRYYRNGKRHEESSGSTKKGDAERLLKIREGAVARGEPITAQVGRLRFEDAAQDVVTDYRNNGRRSAAQVERRIRLHLAPCFDGRRMAAISTDDVRAYTDQRLQAGAKPATVNRELAILRRAFRLAQQAGRLLHRPHVPMLQERNVRQGFLEQDEFEDVRGHLPRELQGLATFFYLTGWRLGEVLPLTWDRVDRAAQVIRLEPGTTKNAKGRTLPYGLLPELVGVMEGQWEARQGLAAQGTLCPHVFHRNGRPIRSIRSAWEKATEAAGVPGRLVHDCRRSAARNLIRAGVGEHVAMQVTGHLTPSIFRRYDIVTEDDIREGLGKLAGKEKGKTGTSGRVRRFPASPVSD